MNSSPSPSPVSDAAGDQAGDGAVTLRRPPIVAESSALDLTLRALRPILVDRNVTELCINRPGEAYVETRSGWHCVPLAFASYFPVLEALGPRGGGALAFSFEATAVALVTLAAALHCWNRGVMRYQSAQG